MKSASFKLKFIFSIICVILLMSSYSVALKINPEQNKQQEFRVQNKNSAQQEPVVNKNKTDSNSQVVVNEQKINQNANQNGNQNNNKNVNPNNSQNENSEKIVIATNSQNNNQNNDNAVQNPQQQQNKDNMRSPIIDTNRKIQGNKVTYEPVSYVKELSPAGKASLELHNSGDPEYIKLIENGFESPHYTSKVVENKPTAVAKPANINYLWSSPDPRDDNLWQNVEYNRYNNRLMDISRYTTPAHFTINEVGTTVVHAPSDHGLQITTPTATTMTSSNTFLDLEDTVEMNEESFSDDSLDLNTDIDTDIKQNYQFLE